MGCVDEELVTCAGLGGRAGLVPVLGHTLSAITSRTPPSRSLTSRERGPVKRAVPIISKACIRTWRTPVRPLE